MKICLCDQGLSRVPANGPVIAHFAPALKRDRRWHIGDGKKVRCSLAFLRGPLFPLSLSRRLHGRGHHRLHVCDGLLSLGLGGGLAVDLRLRALAGPREAARWERGDVGLRRRHPRGGSVVVGQEDVRSVHGRVALPFGGAHQPADAAGEGIDVFFLGGGGDFGGFFSRRTAAASF
jgi:hypothetical protein